MHESITSIYLDTCAMSKMEDNRLWKLLIASQEERLEIYISEVVIWERCKARHKVDEGSFFPLEDRGVPSYLALFKKLLVEHGVIIIEHSENIIRKAEEFITDEEANFNLSNSNDLRDAHIMAAAMCELNNTTIIASNDSGFIRRTNTLLPGYASVTGNDIIQFVDENTSGIKKPY